MMSELDEDGYRQFCLKGAKPHLGYGRRPLSEQQVKIFNLARMGWRPAQISGRLDIPLASVYDGLSKIKNNGWDIHEKYDRSHNR